MSSIKSTGVTSGISIVIAPTLFTVNTFITGSLFIVGAFGTTKLGSGGNFTSGASFGLFTFGFTTGADKVVGGVIETGISNLSFLTSLGTTLANISISLIGSLIFLSSTNPHSLPPFVEASIERSLFKFFPVVVAVDVCQVLVFSFPGVIGIPSTLFPASTSKAFLSSQFPLL